MPLEPLPFRIRLGVAGHRQLSDPEGVRIAVRRALEECLFQLCPKLKRKKNPKKKDYCPLAFNVVTMLAEGSDQLAMREVKAFHGATRWEAVIPYSLDKYREEYQTAEALADFEAALQGCHRRTLLRQDFAPVGPSKETAFDNAINHIVEHCDLLIAVLDPGRDDSFSHRAVDYAAKTGLPVLIIDAANPESPIKIEENQGLNTAAMRDIRRFNQIRSKLDAKAIDGAYASFFGSPSGACLQSKRLDIVKRDLLPVYVASERIAQVKQAYYQKAGKVLYLLSPVAVGLMGASLIYIQMDILLTIMEISLLALIYVFTIIADTSHARRKWIESRFLAERCRSSIFLSLAGQQVSPIRIPPHKSGPRAENDWSLRMSTEMEFLLPQLEPCSLPELGPTKQYLAENWVISQNGYHQKRYNRMYRKNRKFTAVGHFTFICGLLFSIITLFSSIEPSWFVKIITLGSIVIPAIGATLSGLRLHGEYARMESASASMNQALKRIQERFKRIHTEPEFEGRPLTDAEIEMIRRDLVYFLRQTEDLTLQEVHDWIVLMRQAPFEGP